MILSFYLSIVRPFFLFLHLPTFSFSPFFFSSSLLLSSSLLDSIPLPLPFSYQPSAFLLISPLHLSLFLPILLFLLFTFSTIHPSLPSFFSPFQPFIPPSLPPSIPSPFLHPFPLPEQSMQNQQTSTLNGVASKTHKKNAK